MKLLREKLFGCRSQILFTVFIASINQYVFSQIQNKPAGPIIPSANATAIGTYGDVPVSLYTGVPNIEIPIYTIEERGINMPVTLRYHAQGFKPDVHPSWVGNNWNLDFGGVISRKLNNLPDEWLGETDGLGGRIRGYYYSHSANDNLNWLSYDTLAWLPISNNDLEIFRRTVITDKEPDEFTFNFLGYSGSFYLDHKGKWRVQCEKNIKVVFDESDMIYPFFDGAVPAQTGNTPSPYFSMFTPKVFGKFTLIDDKGIKYVFGKADNDEAIEYSSSITPSNFDYRVWMIAKSWYLKEVLLPGGEGNISIQYMRGPYQSNFQYTETRNRFWRISCDDYATNDMKGIIGHVIYPVYPIGINTSSGINVEFKFSKSNELTYPSNTYYDILRDINGLLPGQQNPPDQFPDSYFNFARAWSSIPYYVENGINIYNTQISSDWFVWFKLDSISIVNNDYADNLLNKAFKRIVFNYEENLAKRLKLLSLDIKGARESEEKQTYSFGYNNFCTGDEPAYLKNLGDHWGFANATDLNYNSNYGYSWLAGDIIANRASSEWCTKGGVLKEITYPTGGKTSFEYEINKYAKYLPNNTRLYAPPGSGTAGGLRVKKITLSEPMGYSNLREFYYVEGYQTSENFENLSSSGILDGKPNYNFDFSAWGFNYSLYSTNSITPLSDNSGAICGYSEVVEKFKDGSYKIYKFTNFSNGYPDDNALATITPYTLGVPYRSKAFERGRILSEEMFNSLGQPVSKTEYSYIRIGAGADTNFIRSLNKNFGGYCTITTLLNPYPAQTSMGFQVPMLGSLYIAPESFLPRFTTSAAYGYYTYKFLPERIKNTYISYNGSGTQELIQETTNTYDNAGNLIKSNKEDSKGNILSEQFKYPQDFNTSAVCNEMVNRSMIGNAIEAARYKNETGIIGKEIIEYDFFNNGMLIKPRYVKTQIGNGTPFINLKFNKYDYRGNVLETEDRNGRLTSYLYSYGQSRLVARIDGVGYDAVSAHINQQILISPYQGEQQFSAQLEALRGIFPNSFISTFYYDHKGGYSLKLSRDINNKPTYYNYDNVGRLITIKDMDDYVQKKIDYKYLQSYSYPFKNVEKYSAFYKSDCPYGYYGPVSYNIPYGKYGSFINQQDADQKAQDDIDQNGQAYANANGVCIPFWQYNSNSGWNCFYSNFALNGNGTVTFSIVIMKNPPVGGGGSYTLVGTLTGPLFLPSTNRYISFSTNGVSGALMINPSGQCYLYGGSGTTYMQISGTYNL